MILHGSGKPKLILDYGLGTATTITLPFCKNLIETFEPEIIQVRLFNGTLSTTKKGWWYSAILDYSDFIKATTLQSLDQDGASLQSLFDIDRTSDLYFYPRSTAVYYRAELDPSTAVILQQRPFHTSHKRFQIKLNGTIRLNNIDLVSTS